MLGNYPPAQALRRFGQGGLTNASERRKMLQQASAEAKVLS
jgi:hypothetical protein